jgi:hypothetical protein
MIDSINFLQKITGYNLYCDGFLEMVSDYKTAKYFKNTELEAALKYASEMSKAGHEIHFGPAVRNEDLGSKRSDRTNILWTKCVWVDIDSPDKTLSGEEKLIKASELKDNFVEALKAYGLEPSFIICSAHGFHIYFVLQRLHMDPGEWAPIQSALITLAKGDQQAKDVTRLLRVPGTLNWKDRNNPKAVEIVFSSDRVYDEKRFSQLVKDHGKKEIQTNQTPVQSNPLGFIPPCINHLLDTNSNVELGNRHQVRLVLATFGFHEGWSSDDVIEKVKHFTDDHKKSEDDIRGVYKALSSEPNKYNVGCGEGSSLKSLVDSGITICDKQNCQFGKPPVQSSPATKESMETLKSADFPGLVDLVLDDKGKIAFLVKDGSNLVLKYEQIVGGIKLLPPPKNKVLWLIPSEAAVKNHFVNDSDAVLFTDLINYFKTISDLPDESHYRFIAAFVMHTYLIDKFEYSPTIWFYAIPERGKTRTGKAMIYTSYRGVHIITLREAHIIRLAKDLKASIFIDVSDLQQKMEANGVEDILLNRYEKGGTVARVLYPEKGPFDDVVYYEIYGATVVATNETVNDTLATRALQIIMPEASRQFNDDVKPIHGLPFKERLLGFKARWMDKDIPAVAKPCNGRLGDILRCIRQIVNMVSTDEKWFLSFVEEVEKKRKLSGADGLDAQVVHAIKESQNTIENGHMLHQDILSKINVNRLENEKISPQKLGKITARLGFEKYTSGQQRGIYWDRNLFVRLCGRYGIEITEIFETIQVQSQGRIDNTF